ncbi:MAG: hypothetical protein ABR553_00600 [Gammaproteobacteria bacterium]
MSVVLNPLPAVAAPYPETPRPAPQAHQESARPVVAPEKAAAAAQESDRDEEHRIQHDQERRSEQRPAGRAEAAVAETDEPHPASEREDILVGSLVDDYA